MSEKQFKSIIKRETIREVDDGEWVLDWDKVQELKRKRKIFYKAKRSYKKAKQQKNEVSKHAKSNMAGLRITTAHQMLLLKSRDLYYAAKSDLRNAFLDVYLPVQEEKERKEGQAKLQGKDLDKGIKLKYAHAHLELNKDTGEIYRVSDDTSARVHDKIATELYQEHKQRPIQKAEHRTIRFYAHRSDIWDLVESLALQMNKQTGVRPEKYLEISIDVDKYGRVTRKGK